MRRAFLKDSALNLCANALPIVCLQLVIFPALARVLNNELYGFTVVVYSLLSLAPGAFGNVLNNLRLIHSSDWDSDSNASFNILLAISALVSGLILYGYAISSGYFDFIVLMPLILTVILWLMREYGSVAFLIELNYKKILLNSLLMCLGYLGGFLAVLVGAPWPIIFLVGQAASVAFLLLGTDIFVVKNRSMQHIKQLTKETAQLSSSVFIGRLSAYCDRVILFPLLGGYAVAVYYAAAITAKLINMCATSLNSVLLSYLAKKTHSPKKEFFSVLVAGFMLCSIFYGLILVISPGLIELLYPQFLADALPLVPLTAAISLIAVLSSLVGPYVMRFRSISWQIIISIFSIVLYLLGALILLPIYGLVGFCVGALIAEVGRLLIQIILFCFIKEKTA